MKRAFYGTPIEELLHSPNETILGRIVQDSDFPVELTQRNAWLYEITLLQSVLREYSSQGAVYFEFSVPRLGKRIDIVLILDGIIFVLEFKVGETQFTAQAIDQVYDYALDLKNFHETSHKAFIAPILIATKAPATNQAVLTKTEDRLFQPICCSSESLGQVIQNILEFQKAPFIDFGQWQSGRYCPTPTIIEAAMALYGGHCVTEISRSDAGATNLTQTSDTISEIIVESKAKSHKSICFVTGVPGAGKTLVGLDIATQHIDKSNALYSVFLSGNGPLVAILREALARDKVRREKEKGKKVKLGVARSEVKAFIQNVHHFRDDCLIDSSKAPVEHVAIFDEAQRAWNREQTSKFMQQKKGHPHFEQSEPEFLISCLDRHGDWAVIVCLVGGGQEINTGEGGISEWIDSLNRSFQKWNIHISSRLTDTEYGAGAIINEVKKMPQVSIRDELHLGVSMRSFRAENVSLLMKQLLDLETVSAKETLKKVQDQYPILLTRSLFKAKEWLRKKARGSERYGIIVSSQAQRLKPHAIDVRSPVDPIHWFLDGKEDVRSSYYMEDVATEFHVQGLELDYTCVTWDGDFRFARNSWEHWSFVGSGWNRIRKQERQYYLKNAYRVLLTRARQGMVIVVPEGDPADPTRQSNFYDPTYDYLEKIGFETI